MKLSKPIDVYIVIKRDPDGGYIGDAPQLRGCHSQGDTFR
jgi:predicted RNase H-like HicB family nuclease